MNGTSEQNAFQKMFEGFAVIAGSLAFTAYVLGITLLLLAGNKPGGRDVVSYWVAGHQMLRHADPYDSATVLSIERSVGFPLTAQSLIMRNPPSALALVLPLGFVGLRAGALLWSLLSLAVLIVSVHLLWVMRGRPESKLHYLGYSFGPALACILSGQSALFALLGLVLFLRFNESRPLAAGLALWFCALKPHLFLPFGAVLLVWIVVTRSYRILVGAAVALAASSALATLLNPAVWRQYRQMMRASGIETEFIPCLGVLCRFLIHRQAMWIEYIPAALGCLWAVFYFQRHRDHWDWKEHGALLMLVSIVVSPYAWLTDQALLIPALLFGAYRSTSRSQIWVLVLAGAALEAMLLMGITAHSPWLLWTAPLWLGWFLWTKPGKPANYVDVLAPGILLQS